MWNELEELSEEAHESPSALPLNSYRCHPHCMTRSEDTFAYEASLSGIYETLGILMWICDV
jgi:hypothetical protein